MRIELTSVLATDFVMRPQSWFVSDLDTGASLVRRLFLLDQDKARLAFFLRQHGVTALPRLNASSRVPLSLSPRQNPGSKSFISGTLNWWRPCAKSGRAGPRIPRASWPSRRNEGAVLPLPHQERIVNTYES